MQEALKKPSKQEVEENTKIIKEKIQNLKSMLQRLIKDDQAFAMKCRELQFSHWLTSQNWKIGKEKYENFLLESQHFSSRYTENKNYNQDVEAYQNFFHPIIQGNLIRGQMNYYAITGDQEGNFAEIHRKTELLFQMAKDEAFWASTVLQLISDFSF